MLEAAANCFAKVAEEGKGAAPPPPPPPPPPPTATHTQLQATLPTASPSSRAAAALL